ncbi:hypothetical protein C8R47DRAFT_155503 [Mycena vitilis]|nr:hypothetical protein C8R47DRAFT_155503 [Mycena vitilis]
MHCALCPRLRCPLSESSSGGTGYGTASSMFLPDSASLWSSLFFLARDAAYPVLPLESEFERTAAAPISNHLALPSLPSSLPPFLAFTYPSSPTLLDSHLSYTSLGTSAMIFCRLVSLSAFRLRLHPATRLDLLPSPSLGLPPLIKITANHSKSQITLSQRVLLPLSSSFFSSDFTAILLLPSSHLFCFAYPCFILTHIDSLAPHVKNRRRRCWFLPLPPSSY